MGLITILIYCRSPQRRKESHRGSAPESHAPPPPPSSPSMSVRESDRKPCCSSLPVFPWTALLELGIQSLRPRLFLPISILLPGGPCCYRWLRSWGWERRSWVYSWFVPWFQFFHVAIFLFLLSAFSTSATSSGLTGSPSPSAESPRSRSWHSVVVPVAKVLAAEVAPHFHTPCYSVLKKGYLL